MTNSRQSRDALSADDLAKEIIKFGQNKEFEKLQELVANSDTKLLERAIIKKIDRSDGCILWNYLFVGCDSPSEAMATKRFNILLAVLNEMNKVEITSKQNFDLITRTFIELPKLRVSELITLCEYCTDSLRMGDPKCTGWKELFPELLKLLSSMPKITVNNEIKTGNEYCDSLVKTLLSLRWPETVLSSIGVMFLETPISKTDKVAVLSKLCGNLLKLEPQELPTLAFQLFTLCSSPAHLMIPLIALNQYFYKYLYQKQFTQSDSSEINYDSIDRFSDGDLISAQNTILYHLSNCAEHKISEKELVQQIRPMASNPKFILTPFLMSALLTICNVSRYLESARLSGSSALPFLRTVIQNNEKELEMCQTSAWCRDTLEHHPADVNKLFSILVQQSKEDIFTPGLVGMAFVLLKTPQYSAINVTGIHFIEEIVKARYQLGYGILRNLKEFLFADQAAAQYGECLTRLSLTNPMMISEQLGQLKEIMDFFLLIPGHNAMRMMTFILPLTKHNNQVRDYFIDVLRRAMYQSNLSTRQMAIYGFCSLLKQQRLNSSWRSSSNRIGPSQMSISGFSLMSQQTLGTSSNPNNMFDMFVLEIIGILRKCFNQPYEIKSILYDGLISAIQQNTKLITHVLQFIDWHFRSYFLEVNEDITINFDKCITEIDEGQSVQVQDHIGRLIQFMSQCIVLLESSGLDFDVSDLKDFFENLLSKITTITLEQLGLIEALTPKLNHIGQQFLNCLEGVMYYCLKTRGFGSGTIETIYRLFGHHQKCLNKLQDALAIAKRIARKKTDDTNVSTQNKTALQNIVFKPENIWDLQGTHAMLEALSKASAESFLHDKIDFCVYILNVTSAKAAWMRSAPEYMQIKYSKSNFKCLSEITALILKNFVKNLPDLLTESNIQMARAAAECFKECLSTASSLYQRKIIEFLKVSHITVEKPSENETNVNMIRILHNILDTVSKSLENNDVDIEHHAILVKLFQSLDILYTNISLTIEQAAEVDAWLQNYCEYYSFEERDLTIMHKLLFAQQIRVKNGEILSSITKQIERLYGQIEDEPIEGATEMKSINAANVDTCIIHLCQAVRKQIEDVEYFINKARSYCIQLKIGGQTDDERENCENRMTTIERRICSQLVFIFRVCLHLSNSMLPLGPCMDNLVKLLIQYYTCLTNLSKHFINRHRICPVSSKSTKFYQLVQTVGKKLPLKIYRIIAFIEDAIDDGNNEENTSKRSKRKNDGKMDRARVMRETKNIPKLVLRIETWNKFVIALSKKTDHDLSKCLHIGTVRDFRIKTPALREAIEKYRQQGSDSDAENGNDVNIETEQSDEDSDIDIDDASTVTPTTSDGLTGNTISSGSGSIIKEKELDRSVRTAVIKNVEAINKKLNKRKNRSADDPDESDETNRTKKKKTIKPPTASCTRRSSRLNSSKD